MKDGENSLSACIEGNPRSFITAGLWCLPSLHEVMDKQRLLVPGSGCSHTRGAEGLTGCISPQKQSGIRVIPTEGVLADF